MRVIFQAGLSGQKDIFKREKCSEIVTLFACHFSQYTR